MNARGVGVDLALTDGALDCAAQVNLDMAAEARTLTGLPNPGSRTQLLGWLSARGLPLPDLRAETVAKALTDGSQMPADVRRVLEIRQQLGKTSNTKYDAVRACAGPDKRIRGTLQFYGASRTGRWAGRLLQVQNLPRTYISPAEQEDYRKIVKLHDGKMLEMLCSNVNDLLSQLIRTVLVPAPGCVFIDADFSAIEARLIAWLAGEDWVLDGTTGKIYEATASKLFHVPFESIVKGNPNYRYRQRGKVATLALGYQGGIGAMKRMGGDALGLDDAGLQEIVDLWRQADAERRLQDDHHRPNHPPDRERAPAQRGREHLPLPLFNHAAPQRSKTFLRQPRRHRRRQDHLPGMGHRAMADGRELRREAHREFDTGRGPGLPGLRPGQPAGRRPPWPGSSRL